MRKMRSVHAGLMINYVLFSVILGIIGFLVYKGMYDARDQYLNQTLPMVEANHLIRDDWEKIPYNTVQSLGGYIQVLDPDFNVVFSRGSGIEKAKSSYTEEEIYAMFYDGNRSAYHSLAPIVTPAGETYRLLVTIPGGTVQKESRLAKTNAEITGVFVGLLLRGLLWFAAAFLVSLWLYSRITAKRITKPLAAVTRGLDRIAEGKEDGRLFYRADRELMDLQFRFNRMADRLKEAEAAKRKLEEGRRRMMMDISHDLKTPITTIQGYAEVLRLGMEKDEHQRHDFANRMYTKARFIASLVDDLFELTKLESLEPVYERKTEDLAELCRTAAADLYDSFEQKGIDFDIRIPETPVPVCCHEGLMRRAVANLLSNALKYNPGGTSVWLMLETSEENVRVTVGDNGPGIAEDVKETVFEPFVRGDRARRSDGGSGLGLSIAKGAVERHEGRIWLDPEAKGTVIHVLLPLKIVKAAKVDRRSEC
ncbi:HAMP domain-containing sensor histidine kinase [Paenibacillus sp. VCA1]|uniref:sensor histidine kinase n=1 Tax=Paenibacillus sp. VCA1 TaxID=3039148 RepID=UPI00287193A4|nr:HAMP domain-containing sensor histidine kinase [Paenibacillus sp. VCA1]MDR9857133.1 HAMP domain-containing sensor histidine kinase [Paenibacillus sp. VCA1]